MPMGLDKQIEDFKNESGLSYIEAFLEFCEIKELDPEEIVHDLNKPLLEKIKTEFIKRKMVKNERITNEISVDFL